MFIKHCLKIYGELAPTFGLKLSIVFVPLEKIKAISFVRMRKAWLEVPENLEWEIATVPSESLKAKKIACHASYWNGQNSVSSQESRL